MIVLRPAMVAITVGAGGVSERFAVVFGWMCKLVGIEDDNRVSRWFSLSNRMLQR
jgi:hypothetical protein